MHYLYVFSFILIATSQFLSAYLSSWGSFPVSDFIYALSYYAFVVSIQAAILWYVIRRFAEWHGFLLASALILLNLFYFSFVLTSWSKIDFSIYSLTSLIIFLATVASNKIQVSSAFFIIQILISTYGLINLDAIDSNSVGPAESLYNSTSGRSIYIIGIDGMVSREALKRIFSHSESVAYKWLENNDFRLYDIVSAGDQTLTTYATLLTGKFFVNPRTVRGLFNGTVPSLFWTRLKQAGYNRQFFNESDYFGVAGSKIESFMPEGRTFTLCNFLDKRWGFYICHIVGYFLSEEVENSTIDDKVNFYIRNVKIDPAQKWVSINHIWYPGHTLGDYNYDNPAHFNKYRGYYINAQNDLRKAFEVLVSYIKSKDSDPVIIFMGDHGAYALRSQHITNEGEVDLALRRLDSRGALLAIYPADFCKNKIKTDDTTDLFIKISDCILHH